MGVSSRGGRLNPGSIADKWYLTVRVDLSLSCHGGWAPCTHHLNNSLRGRYLLYLPLAAPLISVFLVTMATRASWEVWAYWSVIKKWNCLPGCWKQFMEWCSLHHSCIYICLIWRTMSSPVTHSETSLFMLISSLKWLWDCNIQQEYLFFYFNHATGLLQYKCIIYQSTCNGFHTHLLFHYYFSRTGRRKQDTLGRDRHVHCFLTFYRINYKINGRLIDSENNR